MIKKADIVLLVVLVLIGGLVSLIPVFSSTSADNVRVEVDGELYGIYDLNEDRQIEIKQGSHSNKIIIKDGAVSMGFSDCRNQICVKHKSIHTANEQIVCLPNKVLVSIEGRGGVDVISN